MPKKPPLTLVGSTSTASAPLRKLGPHGQALWDGVQGEYNITDVGGVELLTQVCQTADRAEALAARIDADGETVRTKAAGLKGHPYLKDELACRSFIVRGLERLGITVEPIKPVGRPPGIFR
jgi:hypothetical protein